MRQLHKHTKRPLTALHLPDLEIVRQLRLHRLVCHGSEDHNLVMCKECARLEGELELLIRFLDAPGASEEIQ
jgi:hypothetical protein